MSESLDEVPPDLGLVRTEVTVSTADLRAALKSVVVHAGQDKEDPVMQRVRATIRSDNLLVAATNRYTVGVAVVSAWDNTYDDDGVILDLTLAQVREILAMFRAGGKSDEDAGDDDLRLRLTDRYLVATDTAGLFPGKEVTWPRVAVEESFPDLLAVTGRLLVQAGTGRARKLHTSGQLLSLFKAAATVYKEPIVVEHTRDEGGALCLSVGESFVGALMPVKPSDETLAQHGAWRAAWHRRLGAVDPSTGELFSEA